MPDYGKIAYLRTEDLTARTEALENRKEQTFCLTLNEDIMMSTTDYNLLSLPVQGKSGGSIHFQCRLTAEGGETGAGGELSLALCWDGVETVRLERTLAAEAQSFDYFSALTVPSGAHTLTVNALATGPCYLERVEMALTGNGVSEIRPDAHYAAFGSRFGEIFLLDRKGGLDLINQPDSGQTINSPARTLPRPDDFAACEIFSGTVSNTLFFRLTGRDLYGGLLNLFNGEETLQKLAGGISAVSCVTTAEGALAAVVQNGKILLFSVTMSGETPIFGAFSEVQISGMAEKVCLIPDEFPHLLYRTGGVFYLRNGSASGFSGAIRVGLGETCNGWVDEEGLHLGLGADGCVYALSWIDGALSQPQILCLADEVKRHSVYTLMRISDRYTMKKN